MKYVIWHDNDFDLARWTYEKTVLKEYEVEYRCIPKTNSVEQIWEYFREDFTRVILPYIRFETPDLIIQKIDGNKNPVISVTELMTHTPQWQHPAQRFTRLYNSSILRKPTALIVPDKKIKWEKGKRTDYKATCYTCSPSVYQLFYECSIKNNTPTLIFNWPDSEGYLKYDQYHQTSPHVSGDIEEWISFINNCIYYDGKLDKDMYKNRLIKMKSKGRKVSIEDFDTIEGIFDTESIIDKYKLDKNQLSINFITNPKTLVFSPNGLACKNSKFRTDPYAGILCAYDILFCRDDLFYRGINLLLIAKDVNTNEINFTKTPHIAEECSFINVNNKLLKKHLKQCIFTQPKYRRIYGTVSDVIIFKNEIFYNKGEKNGIN